jgi:hypothetical protein
MVKSQGGAVNAERFLMLAAVALIASSGELRADPEQYLCISEHVAGVNYGPATKTWSSMAFAGGQKWILRRLKGGEREGKYPSDTSPDGYAIYAVQPKDKSEWGFFAFGEKGPRETCDAQFSCTAGLMFNPATLRFERHQWSGYSYQTQEFRRPFPYPIPGGEEKVIRGIRDHPDSGSVAIGTCSGF